MPKIRNLGKYGRPKYDQATKIIKRFGTEAQLAKLIGVSRITLYRWNYTRPCGSDGLVPSAQIEKIKSVARMEGILLRPEDWVPRAVEYETPTPRQRNTNQPRKSLADLLA